MSASDVFEHDLLALIFNATPIAGLADNAASAPLTSLYLSLHTADPGETGNQTTSETTYGGYTRIAVARTVGGWTVSGNSANPVAPVSFPSCTSGTATVTHFAVGTATSGTGKILISGSLSPTIAVATGVLPQLTTATTLNVE